MFNPFVDSIKAAHVQELLWERPDQELKLMGHLYLAMDTMANIDDPHATPSPSQIHGCRLKMWFSGKGTPRSNRIPPASYKKMETGRHIEGFWREILDAAGFDWEPCPPSRPHKGYRGGSGDGILTVRTEEAAEAVGFPVGTRGLLELKDLGLWTFENYVREGSRGKDIDGYHHQAQAYLDFYAEEFDLKFAILLGGQADNSSVTFLWNRMRKYEGDAPPFWLEILYPDPAMAAADNDKAIEVAYYIDNFEEPPGDLKDYDPEAGKFPCGSDEKAYCGWRDLCLKVRRSGS